MVLFSALFVAGLFSASVLGAPFNLQRRTLARRALPISIDAAAAKMYLNERTSRFIDHVSHHTYY